VGTSFIFSHDANLGTLEGDPRFFFDDSLTPQAQGTGTEKWGGGGDYWGGLNMSLPFAGHPVGARSVKTAVSDEDKIESAYRFLLADLMPFGKNAVTRLEHGGANDSDQHYETVTFGTAFRRPRLYRQINFRSAIRSRNGRITICPQNLQIRTQALLVMSAESKRLMVKRCIRLRLIMGE
jgi:DUF2961 family protein